MPKTQSQNDTHKALFLNLVMMLSSSAMQHLGKIVNPLTNKTEVNLEGARMTIDMLEMIRAKTKGNLDTEEDKMLGDLISSLQMNYVETAQSAPQPDADQPGETPAETETSQPPAEETPDEPVAPSGDSEEHKDPKYHKSYGEDK